MAVRTIEEVMTSVRARIGEDTSDEALALIEDIHDTLTDYDNRTNNDGVDWKDRYEQNDKEWRTKYRERFFESASSGNNTEPEEEPKKLTFDNLFKEV